MQLLWQLQAKCSAEQLPLRVCMDDQCQELLVDSKGQTFSGFLDDARHLHRLDIYLEHKSPKHTVVDDHGQIIQDRCITLQSLKIDCLDFTPVLYKTAQYHHNHNGQQPEQTSCLQEFMGWNGRVTFDFTSPIYLWLLRHEFD